MTTTTVFELAHPALPAQLGVPLFPFDLLRDPSCARIYTAARRATADKLESSLVWVALQHGQRIATLRDTIVIRDVVSVAHSDRDQPWGVVVVGHASFTIEDPSQYLAYLLARFFNNDVKE